MWVCAGNTPDCGWQQLVGSIPGSSRSCMLMYPLARCWNSNCHNNVCVCMHACVCVSEWLSAEISCSTHYAQQLNVKIVFLHLSTSAETDVWFLHINLSLGWQLHPRSLYMNTDIKTIEWSRVFWWRSTLPLPAETVRDDCCVWSHSKGTWQSQSACLLLRA